VRRALTRTAAPVGKCCLFLLFGARRLRWGDVVGSATPTRVMHEHISRTNGASACRRGGGKGGSAARTFEKRGERES